MTGRTISAILPLRCVGFTGRECKHFHAGLTTVPVFATPVFNIGDHLFERTVHLAEYRYWSYAQSEDGELIARAYRGLFAHFARFRGVQPAGQLASDQIGFVERVLHHRIKTAA